MGIAGCGPKGPAPVEIPVDLGTDPALIELINSKRAAAVADPSNPAAHRTLGLALAANDLPKLAATSFENVLAIDASDAEAHLQLALIHKQQGDSSKEIEKLGEALRHQPNLVSARYALGCALLDNGQLEDATAAFEMVKDAMPESRFGELGLGLVALERSEFRKALSYLQRAAEAHPNDTFIRFKVGETYAALGQDRTAEAILGPLDGTGGRPNIASAGMQEMESYRRSRSHRLTLGEKYNDRGEFRKARAVLEKLVDSYPPDVATLNTLAISYINLGMTDKASTALEQCIELDPEQFGTYLNIASCKLAEAKVHREGGDAALEKQRLLEALEASDNAIERAPRVGQAYNARAQTLVYLRRDLEAITSYRKAIELGRDEDDVYADFLRVLERYSGSGAAVQMLEETIQREPSRIRLRYELCRVLVSNGQGAKAREQQRELAKFAPGHALTKRADEILGQSGF